jgi:hypothetical protein
VRNAEREAAKKVAAAERAEATRKGNELAAEQRAAEAETALRLKREADEQQANLLAEQKAARDARYSARKAAKKERRKGPSH